MKRTIPVALAAAMLPAAVCGSAFGKANAPYKIGTEALPSTTAEHAVPRGQGLDDSGMRTAFTLIELIPINPPPKGPQALQGNKQGGKATAKKVPGKKRGRLKSKPRN